MTDQAWMYTMDLPKRDSMLLEAASERDQHSSHHPDRLLHCLNSFLTIVTKIRPFLAGGGDWTLAADHLHNDGTSLDIHNRSS
jgi:hypothetical protein